jgi:hypothetical protein
VQACWEGCIHSEQLQVGEVGHVTDDVPLSSIVVAVRIRPPLLLAYDTVEESVVRADSATQVTFTSTILPSLQ